MISDPDSPDPFAGGFSPQPMSRTDSINPQQENSRFMNQQPPSQIEEEPPKRGFAISIKDQLKNKTEEEREDDFDFQESTNAYAQEAQYLTSHHNENQTVQTQAERDFIDEKLKQAYPNRYFIVKNLKENLATLCRDLEYCSVASKHESLLKSAFRVPIFSFKILL